MARIAEIEESDKLDYVMDIGFDLVSSRLAAEHAAGHSWCYAAVGYHPHEVKDMGAAELDSIWELAQQEKVKAIGEIGLDFHYDHSPRDIQREAFRRQIRLALEMHLPIVIHSREADQETMDILREEGAFDAGRKETFLPRPTPDGWEKAAADARVLLHCFSGSAELGEQYVKLGATISVAGPVTYKNNKKTVKVVERIPREFLLAETDSPYLTPEPMRGRPNRSPYIEYTVRRMAEIKGMTFEEMALFTERNAERFYNITGDEK